MGVTPFFLVYGVDVVLPIEVKIPTLWVSLKGHIIDDDYRICRLQELELPDEHRQVAFDYLKAYKKQMSKRFNKKVKPRDFQVGNLVLRENLKNQQHRVQKGKFEPKWLGPYIITTVLKAPINSQLMKENCSRIQLTPFTWKDSMAKASSGALST